MIIFVIFDFVMNLSSSVIELMIRNWYIEYEKSSFDIFFHFLQKNASSNRWIAFSIVISSNSSTSIVSLRLLAIVSYLLSNGYYSHHLWHSSIIRSIEHSKRTNILEFPINMLFWSLVLNDIFFNSPLIINMIPHIDSILFQFDLPI